MFENVPKSGELWQELLDYWKRKHVDGRPPAFKDIDPIVDIPRIVANLMVLDILPDGFRYRICGSAHVSRWGTDMTGKRVGARSSVGIPIILPTYRDVATDQQPKLIVARSRVLDVIQYILIVLPLVKASGETDCLLAASFYEGDFRRGTQMDGVITRDALF